MVVILHWHFSSAIPAGLDRLAVKAALPYTQEQETCRKAAQHSASP